MLVEMSWQNVHKFWSNFADFFTAFELKFQLYALSNTTVISKVDLGFDHLNHETVADVLTVSKKLTANDSYLFLDVDD